jgi:uncharacterized protein DUF3263
VSAQSGWGVVNDIVVLFCLALNRCTALSRRPVDSSSEDPFMDAANAFEVAAQSSRGGLSDRDQQILAFERQWWKYAGAKEQAIRELFGMSATRYYQILNALIDRPEALAHDPMLVKRLRRLRTARQRARSARRLGVEA